ncbi:hypothetical protein BGZ50_002068 [Haplosporangium sp. Z 11]|nr:hypothetical protein BGZ50_002068 [Haplosporangium sp. Z 11]
MPSSHSLKTLLKGHTSSDQQDAHSSATLKNKVGLINATPADTKSTTKPQNESSHSQPQGKASEQLLEPSSRKRSMLLNMVLPPEAPPVDAKLAIPPVVLFPPVLEPEGPVVVREREMPVANTAHTSTRGSVASAAARVETNRSSSSSSTTTAWSLRSLVWGSQEAAAEQTITRRSKIDQEHKGDNVKDVVKSLEIDDSETTTVVSKTTQIRTWISKISRSEESEKPGAVSQGLAEMNKGILQAQQQQQQQQEITQPNQPTEGSVATTTTTTTTTVQHQEIHHKTRSVALVSVNVSVQDIFGLGKVMEMILALFHAHGAFLRRQPFWLQCALLGWEALVILLLVWGVLRVVGLAEVIVWGADDLVRGTISTLQTVGRTMLAYFSP